MTRREAAFLLAATAIVALLAWAVTTALERVMRPAEPQAPAAPVREEPPAPVRHITATLFHVSNDGQRLVAVRREVPFGEGAVEQGRQIVLAQLAFVPEPPLVAAVPSGVTLRSFYVSERGEAFVDLGPEIATLHPGGSAAELLTVHAIVNAVAANLAAVERVQILVDGREADTLAGHVDIRRPLSRTDALVRQTQ